MRGLTEGIIVPLQVLMGVELRLGSARLQIAMSYEGSTIGDPTVGKTKRLKSSLRMVDQAQDEKLAPIVRKWLEAPAHNPLEAVLQQERVMGMLALVFAAGDRWRDGVVQLISEEGLPVGEVARDDTENGPARRLWRQAVEADLTSHPIREEGLCSSSLAPSHGAWGRCDL